LIEKRQAQEALRARELVSREILDNIPIHISLLSATGDVELINRQVLDYTGQTTESLAHRGMLDLVYPEDLARSRASFLQGLSAGDPFDVVYRVRRFHGAYRWFEARHRPLKDGEGSVLRWCVSMNDIDDRKHRGCPARKRAPVPPDRGHYPGWHRALEVKW
jgi:PAS domain S-box-containing protein